MQQKKSKLKINRGVRTQIQNVCKQDVKKKQGGLLTKIALVALLIV